MLLLPAGEVERDPMNIVRRFLSNWLAPGLVLITLVLLVTQIVFGEGSIMDTMSVPSKVSLLGSKVSQSGFSVATEITHESRDGKGWPYLSVSIFSQDGIRLYQSGQYAAWFEVRLCWDDANRLWIVSKDIGIDIIAPSPNGWSRLRWMPDGSTKTMLDAESGDRLIVVDWEPPSQIKGCVDI